MTQTAQIFDKINSLPERARGELFEFLKFLEWKYAEQIEPMSDAEFEAYIADRASDTLDEGQLISGEAAITELRGLLEKPQRQR